MQLVVLHVAAPPQKKNLVPATLRPEQLESGVKDRNIRLEQDIKFLSRDREPGGKAGDVVRAAAPPRTLRRSPSRHHASLPSSLQLMPEPAGALAQQACGTATDAIRATAISLSKSPPLTTVCCLRLRS